MERLFKSMEQSKDITFIKNEKGESVTYGDALEYCDRIKEIIPERCFVFIFTKNNIGGVLNYMACVKNRIVPFLIDAITNEKLVAHLMEAYKPRYIFIPTSLKDRYSDFKVMHEEYDYLILRTNYDEKEDLYEDLCMCMTTSGSTGAEKVVRLSYNNIGENTQQEWDFFLKNQKSFGKHLDRGDFRTLVSLPICYSFIILVINITVLGGGVAGGTILITEKNLFEKEFWEFFFKEQSSALYGIPYHIQMLDKIHFFDKKCPFFSQMVVAGGQLTDELYEKCVKFSEENGSLFGIGYGQCEATAGISQLEATMVREKRGSIGKGLDGLKLYLVDENDNVIDTPNTPGELICEGPNVALGYAYSREDLAKGDEFNGKIHTGDIAICDEDGYYFIKGRKKRFIKVYGNSINLDNVELIVKSKYKDVDCICVGVDDDIRVFVNNESIVDELTDYLSDMLKFNKKAISVRYLEKMIRNETGKVLYSKMMEL